MNQYNNILSGYKNLYKDYGSRYSNGYTQIGNSEFNDYSDKKNLLIRAINTLDVDLGRFKGAVPQETLDAISGNLTKMRDGFDPLSEYVKNGTDYYSQFKDSDEYNKYLDDAEQRKILEQYSGYSYDELKKIQQDVQNEQDIDPTEDKEKILRALGNQWYTTGYSTVEDYDKAIADADAEVQRLTALDKSNRENTPLYGSFSRYDPTQNEQQNASAYKNLASTHSDLKTAEERKAYLESQKRLKENEIAVQEKYGDTPKNSDFAERSRVNDSVQDLQYQAVNGKLDPSLSFRTGAQNIGGHSESAFALMHDDERKLYNYIFSTEGSHAASEYLNLINIDKRAADLSEETIRTNIENGGFGTSALYSAVTPVTNTLTAIPSFVVNVGQSIFGEVNPYSALNTLRGTSNVIRSSVSDKIEDSVGGFGGKALSEVYNAGMSVADNLLGVAMTGGANSPKIVGALGAYDFVMGTGAASDTLVEAKKRGLADGQAIATALGAGVAETLFEHASLENLKSLAASGKKTFGTYVMNFLKQSFTEGSEEFFTDIANAAWDSWVNGGGAELEQKRLGYIMEGMSVDEAEAKVAKDFGEQVGESFLLGAMSGGMMSVGASAVGDYRYRSGYDNGAALIENGEVQGLRDAVSNADKNSAAYKFAQKLSGVQTEDLSPTQVGRLYNKYQQSIRNDAVGTVSAQINDRLSELGVPEKRMKAVSKAVTDAYVNGKTSVLQNVTLNKKEINAAQTVVAELSKQGGIKDFASKAVESATGKQETAQPEFVQKSQEAVTQYRQKSDVAARMASIPIVEATDADGNKVSIGQFTRVDGENSAVQTESGETTLSALNLENEGAAALYSAVAKTATSTYEANAMLRHYNGQNVQQYVNSFNRMVTAGAYATSDMTAAQAVEKYAGFADIVGTDAAKAAFNVGKHVQNVRNQNAASVQQRANATAEETQLLQEAAANMSSDESARFMDNYVSGMDVKDYADAWNHFADVGKKGLPFSNAVDGVNESDITAKQARTAYDAGVRAAKNQTRTLQEAWMDRKLAKTESGSILVRKGSVENNTNQTNLSEKQKSAVQFVRQMSKLTGLDFVLFQSDYTGMNGKYLNGKIWLDLNSGSIGEQAVLRTLGHELTHFIQEFSPAQYEEFRAFLFDELNHYDDTTVQRLMVQQIENAKKNNVRLTEAQALDEVVADACEMMLQDGSAIKKLAQSNLSTKEKIIAKINDLLNMIAKAFEGVIGTSNEYAELREAKANFEELQRRWNDALADATETFNGAQGAQNEENAKNSIRKSSNDYSYNSLVSKRDMFLTTIDSDAKVQVSSQGRKQLVADALEAAAPFGRYNENGNVVIHVDDANTDVILSTHGLTHGLDRRLQLVAPVIMKSGEILKNSVLVNEMNPKIQTASDSYVLVGAAKNKSDELYIVRFVVNRYSGQVASVDVVTDTLYSMNTKKEPAGLIDPAVTEKSATHPDSTISIHDILQFVNKYFPDILSMDVLNHFGQTMRPAGELGENARYSLRKSTDTEYAELAKDPEKNAARLNAMVEAAAKEAGYDSPLLYHGTQSFGFTNFDLSKMDDGRSIFLTSSPEIASTYSGVGGSRRIADAANTDISKISSQKVAEMLNQFPPETGMDYNYSVVKSKEDISKQVDSGIAELNKLIDTLKEKYAEGSTEASRLDALRHNLYYESNGTISATLWMMLNKTNIFDGHEAFIRELEQNVRLLRKAPDKGAFIVEKALDAYSIEVFSVKEAREMLRENMQRGNYSLYAKLGNSLTVDAKGGLWNQLDFRDPILDERLNTTRLVAEYAKGQGYDSVVFKNLRDNGGMNSSVKMDTSADIYVIFNPSDVKSADPVVRDDSGKVIPLSERFNPENEDIRYSTRKPTKTARQILSEVFSEQSEQYQAYASELKAYQDTLDKLNRANARLEELRTEEKTLRDAKPSAAQPSVKTEPSEKMWAGYESAAREDTPNLKELNAVLSKSKPETVLKQSLVDTVARKLAKSAGIKNSTQLSEKLMDYYKWLSNGTDIAWDGVSERAREIADWMVEQRSGMTARNEEYAPILADLKGTSVFLDDTMKSEIQYDSGNLSAFKKSIGSVVKLTDNPSALRIDVLWGEMAEKYAWAFDPEITNTNEMVLQLKEIIDAARTPVQIEFDADTMARDLASDVYDGFWDIATVKSPDVKHREQIAKLRAAHAKKTAALKQKYQAIISQLKNQQKQQSAAVKSLQQNLNKQATARDDIARYESRLTEMETTKLKKVLDAERRAAVEAMRQKGRQDLQQYREDRRATELRRKINRAYQEFMTQMRNPNKHRYIPQYLAPAMQNLLETLNLGGAQDTKKQQTLAQQLAELRDRYADLKTDNDPDFQSEYDSYLRDQIDDLAEIAKDKTVADMSLGDLERVYRVIRAVQKTLVDAKKLISSRDRASVKQTADKIVVEQRNVQIRRSDKKIAKFLSPVSDFVQGQSLSAMRNVERISGYDRSSALYKLFEDINDGVQKKNMFVMETEKKFADLINQKEKYNKAVGEKLKTNLVDDNGHEVYMTKMQIMQTVMSWEREQANPGMKHLTAGGIKVLDYDLVKKGKSRAAEMSAVRVGISEHSMAHLKQMVSDSYSKEFMKTAHEFFDVDAKARINETMLRLKHYTVANDKSYIPFKVDKTHVVQEIDGTNQMPALIENAGILKEKSQNATQPIIIEGLNDVISEHKDTVGKIYGLAIPVRNFNKVWNAKSEKLTVKESVGQVWNKYGIDLIQQSVQDVQRSRTRSNNALDVAVAKVSSNFASAVLNFNVSVAMKQAASLQTAYLYLKHRNIVTSTAEFARTCKNYQSIIDEIDAHTAQHYMRRIGLSTQELGDIATGLSKTSQIINKIPTGINPTKWIQGIDCLTTAAFWNMCKEDVQNQNPGIDVKSDVYWQKVTDLYDLVIEETQPMYDVLHRPEVQKATGISRYLVMFKTQPLQNAGIIWNTYGEMYTAKKSGDADTYTAAKKKFAKAVASQVESAVVFAVMTLVGRLLLGKLDRYKDDDDEATVWSFSNRILLDTLNSLAGVFLPPWGSDLETTIENAMSGGWFSDDMFTVEALDQVNGLISNTRKVFDDPSMKNVSKLIFSGTTLLGLPAQNAWNLVNGIITNTRSIYRLASGSDMNSGVKVNESVRSDVQSMVNAEMSKRKKKFPGETDEELQKGAAATVKSKITTVQKKRYLSYYLAKNQSGMEDVVQYLASTGLYSDVNKTVSGWVENYLDENRRKGNSVGR